MNEKLLQFIWQFQQYAAGELQTATGEPLQIIQPGKLNHHQGPDFSDARIRTGDTIWAGNIELHVRSSDWNRHAHQTDPNYANVILHVVWENDGWHYPIPLLELKGRIPGILLDRYEKLAQHSGFIFCENSCGKVSALTVRSWLDRLLAERLSRKAGKILELYTLSGNHWDETAWWLLARSFGNPVNADAFESMARSLPLKLLQRHRQQPIQLEALLMGQAGLLVHPVKGDVYYNMLQKEYRFLQTKYSLRRILMPVHFLRMRPVNFPTVRLAQLASLLTRPGSILQEILDQDDVTALQNGMAVTANDYWHYHYRFGKEAAFQPKQLGETMFQHILINTLIPLIAAWGLFNNDEHQKGKAIRWMETARNEHNRITDRFKELGFPNKTAADSQAILELYTEYCAARRCLECAIGNALLTAET